jgi:Pyruvate/2-oxoacid:ferredoxin oxidoreductase delta subunit
MILQTPGDRLRHSLTQRGLLAWLLCALLMAFYAVLYFGWPQPEGATGFAAWQGWLWDTGTRHLEATGQRWLSFGDPQAPLHYTGNRWTLYGLLYTLAITGGGAWMLHRYRHNRYQVIRTLVVMVVQVSFAFSIPILLRFFGHPEFYFSYLWPLKIEYLDPRSFHDLGGLRVAGVELLIVWSFLASLLLVPLATLRWGKRWYCSWVCGCGGLANTFGEPWRHLSQKSTLAWRIEKITIHTMLAVALVSTGLWFLQAALPDHAALRQAGDAVRSWYGLVVTAILSGVVGTALYPVGGTRVWCRYFCPMAALLGILQKFSRFRIRVKKDMCIGCGLCTHFCEMGIDVRAYALGNRSFVRASCVGCGMCEEVCPRGVLHLENAAGEADGRLRLHAFLDGSWKG